MKSAFTCLGVWLCCLFSIDINAQQGHIVAVNDSICVMAGEIIEYNVTSNDSVPSTGLSGPVFLIGQDNCFGMTPNGQLFQFPGAKDCCGEHILQYRYEQCQPPDKCFATIKIIVKCPKPDCFFVNLDDFTNNTDPAGGNQGSADCVFACENSGAVYYVSHDSSSTYTWSVTGGSFTPGNNPAEIIVSWANAGSGSISLIINDSNGETTVLEICVDILEGPTSAFQASTDSVCLGSPISFINNSIGGAGFFWDFGDGNTSNMFQPTHQYTMPGDYTVTLIVTKNNYAPDGSPLCCCSDTATLAVFVDSLPGPNIYCISTLCAGDSSKYWTDATNCANYTWSVFDENGLPWPFTGQGNDTICVHWGNGPTGAIVLDATNCDSAYCNQPVSVVVPIISPSVIIAGLTDVCENATVTYTVPKWPSVDYNWQITGGTILSGQGTNTVVIQWGTAPGPGMINLTYASNFLGGLPGHDPEDCAGKSKLNVAIKPAFDVSGPAPSVVCANSSSSFSATAVPSSNYTWTISPGVTFTGQGTNAISVTWDAGPGTFVVTATPNNPAAYCNNVVTKVIQVVETPKPTGIEGPLEICPGVAYSYLGQSAQNGTGFTWTVVGGTPASFTGNPISVTWNAGGPYSLALQQFSLNAPYCASDTILLNVNAKQLNGPLTITGPTGCINSVQNYTGGPAQHPDATYLWTVLPATAGSITGGQGTPNAQIQWNNTPGAASLQLKVYLCNDSLVASLPFVLNAAATPVITQTGVLCPGASATLDAGAGFTAYAWSTFATSQTISINTGGIYIVTTTDANGCTAVGTFQAIPNGGPVASISTSDPKVLCIVPPNSNTVTINALTGSGYTYAWYCNGTLQVLPPTQSTFVHTNTNVVASFNYWVVVTDANGCTKQSNTIQVQQVNNCGGPPTCIPQTYTLSFTSMNQTPNCNNVNFTVTKSANVFLVGWNFGDPGGNTNTGTLANAMHTYTQAGCFPVLVIALVPQAGGGVCTVTASGSACVPLVADFSTSVSCQTVTFSDLSTFLSGQGPVAWSWSFGDLNTSTLQNPAHTYTAGGTYTVTLTVTNAAGCQATITKTVTVPGLPAPVISANPSPACVGVPVNFTATGSNILTWLWDFNDGSMNGSQNPAHTYLAANNYTVSLQVTDNMGCQNTVTLPITVFPAPSPDTIAWSPSLTVCAGNAVTLTAPPGTGYTYLWSTNATTPTITVNTTGTYTVVVTDANGCTLTPDSVIVTILPPPTATTSGPHVICDAGCVTLSASSGFGYTYQWLDNTNTPITGATGVSLNVCDNNLLPSYSVIVTDANGCSATSALFAVALAISPSFNISISPDSCEGTPSTLTVTPAQPNVVYTWNNGGSGSSITVLQAGLYTAIGTDTITGCKGSATATIHPLPDLCLVPAGCYEVCNPDTICGPDGLAGYQWNLNGMPITGATNQCLIVTQSGTYSLSGTTDFGCTASSDSLMLMIVDCDACDQLAVTAEPSESDSCCWSLSYTNGFGGLYGLLIYTSDADMSFDLGSLHDSMAVFSVTANAIGLVHSQTGSALSQNGLSGFLNFCFSNVVNTPQIVIFDWYDFEFQVVCSDTLVFDCPVEPDCLYLASDSIYCKGSTVVYTMTVCNPVDADFAVAYIVIQPKSPAGVIVTPNTIDETANPIQPGECRTYTLALSGPGLENQTFCYALTAHDEIPGEIDTSTCCMPDTMYCVPIPNCAPCDDIGVEHVETLSTESGDCCYAISLYNNFAAGYFDGIRLCMLSTGATMTINNPFGSGWITAGYTPTVIDLNVGPPIGTSLPPGVVQLPNICIQTTQAPAQLLEIKWLKGDSVVCRDTIELGCEPPCGYLLGESIVCDPVTGSWVYTGAIKNTSPYAIGQAQIVFTSPAGLGNATIALGSLASGATQSFTVNIGAPARPGDIVCFTVSLHVLDDNAQHTQCCHFSDCIVLPDCSAEADCVCNDEFETIVDEGIECVVSPVDPFFYTFSPGAQLNLCDSVTWLWTDSPLPVVSAGNASVTHTFPRTGTYSVCMYVVRTTPAGETCDAQVCKDVVLFAPDEPEQLTLFPNPSNGRIYARLTPGWTPDARFRLLDMLGHTVLDRNITDAAGQELLPLELTGVGSGLYTVVVESGGRRWVRKVVVE